MSDQTVVLPNLPTQSLVLLQELCILGTEDCNRKLDQLSQHLLVLKGVLECARVHLREGYNVTVCILAVLQPKALHASTSIAVLWTLSCRRHASADLNRAVPKLVIEEPVDVLGLGYDTLVTDGLTLKDARVAVFDLRREHLR